MNDDNPDAQQPPSTDRSAEAINPFEAPTSPVDLAAGHSHRPNVFDWFFAIFLAAVAVVTVFPTTCIGGFTVLASANSLDIIIAPQFAMVIVLSLVAVCVGLSVAAAFWISRWYIHAVKEAQAKKLRSGLRDGRADSESTKVH